MMIRPLPVDRINWIDLQKYLIKELKIFKLVDTI